MFRKKINLKRGVEVFTTFYDEDYDLDHSTWIDTETPANGIGPICKFCRRLIDWHPFDHASDCGRFGEGNGIL